MPIYSVTRYCTLHYSHFTYCTGLEIASTHVRGPISSLFSFMQLTLAENIHKISTRSFRIHLSLSIVHGICYLYLILCFLFLFCIRLKFFPSCLPLLKINLERRGTYFFHILSCQTFCTTFFGQGCESQ